MEKISGGTWPPTEVTWVGTLCQCGGLPAAAATAGGNHGTLSSVDTYIILWGGAAPLRTEQLLKLLQPFLRTDNEKIHVSASQKWSAHPFVSPIRMAWKPDNNREL